MRLAYSSKLKNDLWSTVRSAMTLGGTVNLAVIAEEVRKRNEIENVALEDVERLVLETAQMLGAIVEFDSTAMGPPIAMRCN